MRKLLKIIVLPLIVFNTFSILYSQDIRHQKDSVGFPITSVDMDRTIGFLRKNVKTPAFPSEGLVAAISPHDDYLYAAKVYYPLFKSITAREFVIFGVTHSTVRKAINDPKGVIILDNNYSWKAPYQNTRTSGLREYIKKRLHDNYYLVSDKAHSFEHSIEGLIPFIQHFNREIKITPIMITAMDFDKMEEITNDLATFMAEYIEQENLRLGTDIFFLISSDANHYGKDFNNSPYGMDSTAHKKATNNDKRIIESLLMTTINTSTVLKFTDELWNSQPAPVWCGKYSIPFGLLTASKVVHKITGKELTGKVYNYSDTVTEGVLPIKNTNMGLTAPANYEHWCGWFSAGFYLQ